MEDKPAKGSAPSIDMLREISGTPEELELIYVEFNSNIMSLVRFIKGKEPDSADVSMLSNILRELINEDPVLIIDRCKDKIWDAREHIRDKNAKYFLDRDYSALIKKDQRESFIVTLVSIIKTGWKTSMYEEEREEVWAKAKRMLKCVALYEKWRRATQ